MARKLRVEYPGAIYHVMNRGDHREPIFQDDDDRREFLRTLAESCVKTTWAVHVYCLMGNHFHLVIETPQGNLVSGMKWFLGNYTRRFNRRGEYFQELVSVVNNSTSVWQMVAVTNSGGGWATGSVFVAKTPEAFAYDTDGNLTQDGRWAHTWDAENRLTQVESLSSTPTASKRKVAWEYDGKGRRIRQTTYDGSSGSYVVSEDLKFLSDGWRHIAELDAANNALVRSYVWGLDLSGSLDGAGGVGGLLVLNSVANGAHFYAYDGNGNVAAMVKASDGTVSANYEYEPFGKIIRSSGAMADENSFAFSTKRTHRPTRIVLYEFRPYDADQGRFLSRDPLGELGGENLYGFVGNDAVNAIDPVGQDFIAVGDRYVTYTPGLFRHMSIEFFEEPCPQTPEGARFSIDSIPDSASGPTDSFELQPLLHSYRHFFYTTPKPTEPPVRTFVWDLVSEIRRRSDPKDFVVIYSDVESPNAAAR